MLPSSDDVEAAQMLGFDEFQDLLRRVDVLITPGPTTIMEALEYGLRGICVPRELARNEHVRALLLFGPSDHVIYPAFDEMAAVVFPDHDGPHRLERCGHFVPWEAADRLIDHVTRFCADLGLRR